MNEEVVIREDVSNSIVVNEALDTDVIIAGVEGAQGPVGPIGPVGPSAYDIAVANGFEGTEEQWLAQLGGELLEVHINDETPHPAYDDLPSLNLLFENGLI